jgi:hypothetical protein
MRIVGQNINGSFLAITKKPIHYKKKQVCLDMNLKRPNITLGLMNPVHLENIYKSLLKFFKLKAIDVYFYNTNLLSNHIHSNSILNSKYRLVYIYKHLEKVFEHGNIYFTLIKHNGNFLKRKIFIKELPLVRPDIFLNNIEFTQNKYAARFPSFYNQELSNFLYNYSNPSYIDIFSHFLCSRLVEEGVSPHFPLFYGVYNTIFSKFTQKFDNKTDFNDFIEENNGIYKCDLYSTICHDDIDKYKVTYNNFPVCLMATEVMDYDLGDFIEDHLLVNNICDQDPSLFFEENITSILFQTIAGISIVHNFWELYHNDLHLGNIMFKNTNQEYIYYYFKNTYYKVPSFGKIVKIIDWNRATMKYNGVELNNLEYTNVGDCRDMYRFQNSIQNQKKKITPNPNFDLALLAYEILNISKKILNKKSKLYKLLIDWTNMNNGDNIYSHFGKEDDTEADFHLYIYIAKYCFNAIPIKQITKPIFTQYRINKSDIPKNEKIYIIA